MKNNVELSIVMPCLNEEKTVGHCVDEARAFIENNDLTAEIIVVDNASTDASVSVATAHGATVIREDRPGYGRAIRRGLRAAKGNVIIICDCDMTYDLYNLESIYEPLKKGSCDVMMGCRKTTEPGAASFTHRIGAGVLSALGRMRYHVNVKDFHCGLRGLTSEANQKLRLRTKGMEFATEMIAEASRNSLTIGQTEVPLKKCPYGRESKLRTIRDGLRHLLYIAFC